MAEQTLLLLSCPKKTPKTNRKRSKTISFKGPDPMAWCYICCMKMNELFLSPLHMLHIIKYIRLLLIWIKESSCAYSKG